ncbi:MAG: TatD family hydrolase [Patescibacteria group bacterium]|nr:TatD family hydrolase [Patescibacteria group bacterium]
MLIDTHGHVNFRAFQDDAKEVLQRALDSGVQVITVGSQIDTSRSGVELANQFELGVYAVVGLHPEHTHSQYVDEEETHFKTREEVFDYEAYKKLAQDPKVVGIGECGLDYYRLPAEVHEGFHEEIKAKQKAAFRAQIKLARELNKVLVIHSRPAKGSDELYEHLLQILDEEGVSGENMRFEVHSYTAGPEYFQKFLDRGAYVSFNGIITFDKTGNMEKLVEMAPLNRIILETDCPYLTPVPNRGKRNEPSFVKFVADKVAEIKKISAHEVAETTTRNAKELFKI